MALSVRLDLLVHRRPGLAEKVTLADGRVLDGRFVMLSGVAVSTDARAAQTPGRSTPIIMCDNDLTRTMAPKRLVQKIEPVAANDGSGSR